MLCTTEAHKIPATIASRCQHFSFRSVDFEDLIARMAWICEQEGIEADPEALAVLAQAGEGSVRDSLSALDQAIACCGSKLNAADVRALLGAFSLESLEKVTQALGGRRFAPHAGSGGRTGAQRPQPAALQPRAVALFPQPAGGAHRRVGDTPDGGLRRRSGRSWRRSPRGFSEEDLTRYLQLSLDLFRDLQFSLQPRFHLEIGLVRLVQAGRLLPIEQALARPEPAVAAPARPAPLPQRAARSLRRRLPRAPAPSPFELDRAKKAASRPPEPQSSGANALAPEPAPVPMAAGDARQRLHAWLVEQGHSHLADAVENARIEVSGADLNITAPKSYARYFRDRGFEAAVRAVFGRPLRLNLTAGEAPAAGAPLVQGNSAREDEASERRARQPGGTALPGSFRRRNSQGSQSQGVGT